ncbi:UNVERIFIED_CONTAM: Retrovirus-related Pol polyprotein from transposon RE1 [Sesamum latifolium]|uniref:Retrovirus-related Pol polyprotein from transposon RE1 n=1 Tax=Sesamum latifolium TaxID=2727402 RepID=A0AAW2X2L0_9LAMI
MLEILVFKYKVLEWYNTLSDKKKKGKTFAANVDITSEGSDKPPSQNVAEIVVEVLKRMQKSNVPSDPLSHYANYAQFDDDFANTSTPTKIDKSCWILDTGATNHVCANIDLFQSYAKLTQPHYVHLPDGSKRIVQYIGMVKLNDKIWLDNVLFVPQFSVNLLSVSQICSQRNCQLLFSQQGCVLQDQVTRDNLVVGNLFRRLYIYKQDHNDNTLTDSSTALFHNVTCATSVPCSSKKWHNRLGHTSVKAIKHILNIDCTEFNLESPCDVCHKAKQSRLQFSISSSYSDAIFDLIHMDLWGPYKANSMSGCAYVLTLVDDHSRSVWTFLLKQKNQVFSILKNFCILVRNQFDKGIKNGRVERKHRHLLNVARALLFQGSLPIIFWGDAILTATYLINRTPTKILDWKTPYEKLYGSIPQYDHLRTFGSLCYATNTHPQRSKFQSRALKCVLIGYSMHQKAYKLFDLNNKLTFFSRDVQFYEDNFPFAEEQSDHPAN